IPLTAQLRLWESERECCRVREWGRACSAAPTTTPSLTPPTHPIPIPLPRTIPYLLVTAQCDRQAERLELLHEHVERLRDPRLGQVLALDDRLVDAAASRDVVGLHRQDLLERVRRAVRLERPHFHLTETLAAELRLAGERLLRDERVWPDRARVDLVVDQVRQFQHVDHADRHRVVELLTRAAVAQPHLAVGRETRRVHELDDRVIEPRLRRLAALQRSHCAVLR